MMKTIRKKMARADNLLALLTVRLSHQIYQPENKMPYYERVGVWRANVIYQKSHHGKSIFYPQIAIVGGGPAGLIAAQILQLNCIKVVVFELDQSPSSRGQGGTLDMHVDSGQLSIKTAKLWNEFKQFASTNPNL